LFSGSEDVTSSIGLRKSVEDDSTYKFNMPDYDVIAKAIIGKKDYKITYEGIE
jgi:hypothetical protein